MEFTQTQLSLLINVLALHANALSILLEETTKDVDTKEMHEEEKLREFLSNVTEAKGVSEMIIKLAEKLIDTKLRREVTEIALANLAWQTKCLEETPIEVNIRLEHLPDLN